MLLPAVGQGAIGIECRSENARIRALIAPLNCAASAARVAAERSMNQTLGGSCSVPVAGHARLEGDRLELVGLVASTDGVEVIRQSASGQRIDAARIGRGLGEALLAGGADRILATLDLG